MKSTLSTQKLMTKLTSEVNFSDKQKKLHKMMTNISDRCFRAAWMTDMEYALWESLNKNDLNFGAARLSEEELNSLKELSQEVGGWIVWIDDEDYPEVAMEKWGFYFIPMDQWLLKIQK